MQYENPIRPTALFHRSAGLQAPPVARFATCIAALLSNFLQNLENVATPAPLPEMPGDAGELGEPARGISQSKTSKYYWRALGITIRASTLLACACPISFAHCTSASSTWNSLVFKVGWHSVFLCRLALHTSNMRSDACLMLSRIAIAAELVGTERAREELGGPHRVTLRLFPLGIAEPPGVGYSRRGEPIVLTPVNRSCLLPKV